jgi:chromosomal replication initiator protein
VNPPYFWLGTEAEWAALKGQRPMARIQCAVANHYEIALVEMRSRNRRRAVARPRQVAMYLARELTPHSLPTIGKHFGNRDHSTVLHAVRAVGQRMTEDVDCRADVEALRKVLA